MSQNDVFPGGTVKIPSVDFPRVSHRTRSPL